MIENNTRHGKYEKRKQPCKVLISVPVTNNHNNTTTNIHTLYCKRHKHNTLYHNNNTHGNHNNKHKTHLLLI